MSDKLNAYYVWPEDDNLGLAVIAKSSRDAKIMGYKYLREEYCLDEYDLPWIDCRIKKYDLKDKSIDISGLMEGVVEDPNEGIRRGLYSGCEDADCDQCKSSTSLTRYTDKEGKHHALCQECGDKMEAQDAPA